MILMIVQQLCYQQKMEFYHHMSGNTIQICKIFKDIQQQCILHNIVNRFLNSNGIIILSYKKMTVTQLLCIQHRMEYLHHNTQQSPIQVFRQSKKLLFQKLLLIYALQIIQQLQFKISKTNLLHYSNALARLYKVFNIILALIRRPQSWLKQIQLKN